LASVVTLLIDYSKAFRLRKGSGKGGKDLIYSVKKITGLNSLLQEEFGPLSSTRLKRKTKKKPKDK
jgi:hypothetical protein